MRLKYKSLLRRYFKRQKIAQACVNRGRVQRIGTAQQQFEFHQCTGRNITRLGRNQPFCLRSLRDRSVKQRVSVAVAQVLTATVRLG